MVASHFPEVSTNRWDVVHPVDRRPDRGQARCRHDGFLPSRHKMPGYPRLVPTGR